MTSVSLPLSPRTRLAARLLVAENLPAGLERYDTREARICRHACMEAFSDSGAPGHYENNVALFVGTTSSGVHELEVAWDAYKSTGTAVADWDFTNQHLAGAIARAMVKSLGLTGRHCTVSTACSSSANAMILAALDICVFHRGFALR